MCGRYYVADEDQTEELRAIIAEVQRRGGEPVRQGEVFPSQTAAVIATSKTGKPMPFAMRWGFAFNGALLINARSETAAVKPMFKDSMAHRRCLIPATCYFEWEKRGREKIKYAIGAGGMIYMAGLYRLEEDGPAFSILTREPAAQIAFIHNRMPVILPEEVHAAWLGGEGNPGEMLTTAIQGVAFKTA